MHRPSSNRVFQDRTASGELAATDTPAQEGTPGKTSLDCTYLDPLETNDRKDHEQDQAACRDPLTGTPTDDHNAPRYVSTSFRHSGWHRLRSRVYEALKRTHRPTARRLAFANCGSTFHVLRSTEDPTKYRLAANACHDRFCMVCGGERSRSIAHNVKAFLNATPCRLVTLTLRSTNQPLKSLLDHLYHSFRELRKTPLWRKTQTGGVAFLEVKRSEKTGLWHPHLHVLAQGKYLDHGRLSTTWHEITKTSHIVDIRLVHTPDSAVAYVAKYASKPMDRTVLDAPENLDQAIVALEGRRLITTFGKWRGLRITTKPDKDKWTNEGTLETWTGRALDGDRTALQVLRSLTGPWADVWLNAVKRKRGLPRTHDAPDPTRLQFVDLEPIPF